MKLLDRNNSITIIIDIQTKLVSAVKNNNIVSNAAKLVQAANILKIPVIISEQYPKGLGPTEDTILQKIPDDTYIVEKNFFSLLSEPGFLEKLKSYNKKQIILCGIETHICVHQTAADLIDAGFDVLVPIDICASRNEAENSLGIAAMKSNGVRISSLEMILFEWLRTSKHPNFKEVQSLIK